MSYGLQVLFSSRSPPRSLLSDLTSSPTHTPVHITASSGHPGLSPTVQQQGDFPAVRPGPRVSEPRGDGPETPVSTYTEDNLPDALLSSKLHPH